MSRDKHKTISYEEIFGLLGLTDERSPLVALHEADRWLAKLLGISVSEAERVVRGALLSRKCLAYGKDRYGVSLDISEEIGATLLPGLLHSYKFDNVLLDRESLLSYARKLGYEIRTAAAEARAAKTDEPGTATRRRGPKPGELRRYDAADRALFPELEQLMREKQISPTAAAQQLANDGKITGGGAPASKATRLVKLFNAERGLRESKN
jgi:hypothetical protein